MNALKNGWTLGSMLCLLAVLATGPLRAAAAAQDAYTVAKGDCLWRIAARQEVFGDPWKWPLLLDANRGRIDDPDLIQPGWTLKVPLSPNAAQIAAALDFARQYKERAGEAAPAPPQPAAAVEQAPPAVAAAPPASEAPTAPVQDPKPAWVLPMASVFLVIVLIAFVVYHNMKQEPEQDVAPAARSSVDEPETPEIVAGPVAHDPQPKEAGAPVAKDPAPTPPMEPSTSGPTDSEAMLRAEQGPDPLHPEDHRHAA